MAPSWLTRHYVFFLLLLVVLLARPGKAAPVKAPGSSFWDTGMRLCDVDSAGKCHNGDYALSVARFGAGGAAAAGVSLLAFLIFIPVRCLCGGFGGKEPSHGACFPSTMASRDYSRKEILSVKIAVVIVAIPIIVGVAIGFRANTDISSSADAITSSLVQSGDNILQDLQSLREILLALPATSGSDVIINDAVETATTIDRRMHDARDTVDHYDKIREAIMIVSFALSLSLICAGVFCVIVNLRRLAIILGMLGLLVMTIVWISFGIHLVAGKFAYDVCVDIDLLTSNTTEGNATSVFKTGALANLWDCGEDSDFAQLRDLVDSAADYAAGATCAARAEWCYDPATNEGDVHWQCARSPACARGTLLVVTDASHMVILDGLVNRTLRDCAANCANAQYRNVSRVMASAVDQFENYTAIFADLVEPLISCQLAASVIGDFRDDLCITMADSLFGVAVSNLIVGLFYVAFVILMVVGYKRFQSYRRSIV